MTAFRTTMIILVALSIMLGFASCKTVAMTGDAKYKSDMSNALQNLKNEIEQDGIASDKKVKKLQTLLDNYTEKYSNKSSYIFSKQAMESIEQAKQDPNNEFRNLQEAKSSIYHALDALKTEVKQ